MIPGDVISLVSQTSLNLAAVVPEKKLPPQREPGDTQTLSNGTVPRTSRGLQCDSSRFHFTGESFSRLPIKNIAQQALEYSYLPVPRVCVAHSEGKGIAQPFSPCTTWGLEAGGAEAVGKKSSGLCIHGLVQP